MPDSDIAERSWPEILPDPVPSLEPDTVQQYVAGDSAETRAILASIASDVIQLRYAVTALAAQLDQPRFVSSGSVPVASRPFNLLLLGGEKPLVEPAEGVLPNYKVRVAAIRTDSNGKYQKALLLLLQGIPGLGNTNQSISLAKPEWESEFKHA